MGSEGLIRILVANSKAPSKNWRTLWKPDMLFDIDVMRRGDLFEA